MTPQIQRTPLVVRHYCCTLIKQVRANTPLLLQNLKLLNMADTVVIIIHCKNVRVI